MNCGKLATPVIFVVSAPAARGERPAQWLSIELSNYAFLERGAQSQGASARPEAVPPGFSEIIKFLLVGVGFGSLAAIALRFFDLALRGVGGL
jgi:hypothetical protein